MLSGMYPATAQGKGLYNRYEHNITAKMGLSRALFELGNKLNSDPHREKMILFYCLKGKGYETEPVIIVTDGSWSYICVQTEQAIRALLFLYFLEYLVFKTALVEDCIFAFPI